MQHPKGVMYLGLVGIEGQRINAALPSFEQPVQTVQYRTACSTFAHNTTTSGVTLVDSSQGFLNQN